MNRGRRKALMAALGLLVAIGSVIALRATCNVDAETRQLVIEPIRTDPNRSFTLSDETFDDLPPRVRDMLEQARATNESIIRLWEDGFDEATQVFASLSENQTGSPHVRQFRWEGQYFQYLTEFILRAHPFWC